MKCKKHIIFFLLLCEFMSLFLTTKSLSNKPIDEVKETYEVDKKQFSMYVENDNGKYSEYISSNMFPEGYQLNLTKSSCVDTKGNEIDGILSGNKNNVTVTSNKTTYCYIYFDIDRPATEELLATVPEEQLWDSTLEDDGYRYVGTNPDNYICFGTTNQEECKNNTDKYMYRIIGIFKDGEGNQHLKLIKKEELNKLYKWHNDVSTNIDWNNSDLYKGINGSYFLTNVYYSYMQDSAWNNIISYWDYTMANTKTYESSGLNYYDSVTVQNIYLHELNRSTKTSSIGEWKTVNAKIGLMYASDYALSLGNGALNYRSASNSDVLKTGWMHISNNEINENTEWTMLRYGDGYIGDGYFAHYVSYNGIIGASYVVDPLSVRPVFYLETTVKFDIGAGTENNPYTLQTLISAPNTILEGSLNISSEIMGGLYRYQGTHEYLNNNYICFGTTNTSECINNMDQFMYRIIGITPDNKIKLIKKEALNTVYVWDSDNTSNKKWLDSELYIGLNGKYFLTSKEYSYMQDSIWLNKISDMPWNSCDITSYNGYSGNITYEIDKLCAEKTIASKIGLMYLYDYFYAYPNSSVKVYYIAERAWIHLNHNDASPLKNSEWTMSRYGYGEKTIAWRITNDGGAHNNDSSYSSSVRPVFYLTENIKITSGKGSITEPFIIS